MYLDPTDLKGLLVRVQDYVSIGDQFMLRIEFMDPAPSETGCESFFPSALVDTTNKDK